MLTMILRLCTAIALIAYGGTLLADGMYAGVAIGSQSHYLTKSGTLKYTGGGATYSVKGTDSAGGVLGSIDLGYHQLLTRRFAFAVEADASMGSAISKIKYDFKQGKPPVINQANQSLRFTLGASILPAIRLGPNADLYVRAGIGMGQFKLTSTGFMNISANSRPLTQDDTYGIFGLGMNVRYAQHWAFRIEGDYLDFAPFQVTENKIDGTTPHQDRYYDYHVRYSPHAVRAVVGINYLF